MSVRPLLLAAAFAALAGSAAGQQAQQAARGPIQVRSIFEGLTLMREGGGASPRVDIRVWSIRGGQRIAALNLPFRGVMIAELRAGELTTVIDGRRVERREGEIWSVPAGSVMQVETEDDTAVLQTTLIGE